VRELVETERGRGVGKPESTPAAVSRVSAVPLAVTATPDDGTRLAGHALWDEHSRPKGPEPDPGRRYTADQQAAAQHLVDIHDGLRAELEQLRDLIEHVVNGARNVGDAGSFINKMAMRQNDWTLGAYCAQYCRIVTGHHTLEDRSIFARLKRSDPDLVPVVDRLEQEHHAIADVLDQVDRALVALVSEPDGMIKLRGAVDLLTDTMLSHLSYEERELIEPLARLGY
jgi:Hemerythrin HHE cation binding domain